MKREWLVGRCHDRYGWGQSIEGQALRKIGTSYDGEGCTFGMLFEEDLLLSPDRCLHTISFHSCSLVCLSESMGIGPSVLAYAITFCAFSRSVALPIVDVSVAPDGRATSPAACHR